MCLHALEGWVTNLLYMSLVDLNGPQHERKLLPVGPSPVKKVHRTIWVEAVPKINAVRFCRDVGPQKG